MSPRFIHMTIAIMALPLMVAACSGDDGTSSAPATAPPTTAPADVPTPTTTPVTEPTPSDTVDPTLPLQEQVAELAILSLNSVSMGFDEACIRDVSLRYSDEDAEAIIAAGLDEQAVLSDEGNRVTDELLECIGIDLGASRNETGAADSGTSG